MYTTQKLADYLGITPSTLIRHLKDKPIEEVLEKYDNIKYLKRKMPIDRAEAIVWLQEKGRSMNEIARVFGISRERVRQIINKKNNEKKHTSR